MVKFLFLALIQIRDIAYWVVAPSENRTGNPRVYTSQKYVYIQIDTKTTKNPKKSCIRSNFIIRNQFLHIISYVASRQYEQPSYIEYDWRCI